MITVGQKFPSFRSRACVGPDEKSLTEISNKDVAGKWAVYVFYPKDFTFVCPTELVEFNNRLKEFKDRDAVIIGGSTDNEFSHLAWCKSHEGLSKLQYPLIAAQKLANDLGIIEQTENVCLRATYLVDPEGTVQWVGVYNLSVGRSSDEVLRVIDACQSDELCPCNWKKGEEFVKAA